MSEKNEKQTSELSMEELDNVAGGGANDGIHGVGVGLGNIKDRPAVTTAPTTTATPATPGH